MNRKGDASKNVKKQKPRIMIIEDNAFTRRDLEELLVDEGFSVVPCKNLYEANHFWQNAGERVQIIVSDLCMDATGLLEDEIKQQSIGGLFSGWLWIWHVVAKNGLEPHPPIKKIIFLTEYYHDLMIYIQNASYEQQEFFRTYAVCISKGDPDDAEKKLLKTLALISR